MIWSGVMPAMTTPFDNNLAVDHTFLSQHAAWLLGNGCTGLVMLGSLGEGTTLENTEKVDILKTAVRVSAGKTPVVAAISSLSTANAIRLAKEAEQAGCHALMVLPPYVYTSDWREMKNHVSSIIAATPLSCMLYNNPVAYKTDFLPSEIAELAAENKNLNAVKESSADVRRVSAIREVLGDRLDIFVGVDDLLVEGVGAGAKGWVAGLVNAYPRSRWNSSNSPRPARTRRSSNFTAGFCLCSGWTLCQSSYNSSSGCRSKPASAPPAYARREWSLLAKN